MKLQLQGRQLLSGCGRRCTVASEYKRDRTQPLKERPASTKETSTAVHLVSSRTRPLAQISRTPLASGMTIGVTIALEDVADCAATSARSSARAGAVPTNRV